jgi:glycosyltransferase involved in cell wall biosynthesis
MRRHTPVMIVLTSLAAEGTPRLTLDLCRLWTAAGLHPVVVILQRLPVDLAPEFDELGVQRCSLVIGHRGHGRYLRLIWAFLRLSRRYRPVAVLSMPLGWHAFMAIGAKLAGVCRVVAHVGNYPAPTTGGAFRKFRLQVQFGRPFTDRLVCCSRYVQRGAIQHFGLREDETVVVYNGSPLAGFADQAEAARAVRSADSHFTVGMVATLQQHKDQPTLIRAAAILRNQQGPLRVLLVGEGARRAEYETLIKAEGLEDVVKLLGMRRDVPELLGGMDVFAFSTTPDEGLGIALIEAMAAGVPIVASDVPACREVLDDGECGLLVAPGDPDAMATAIAAIRSDPAAALERAEWARAKAMRDFDIEQTARRYADLLGLRLGAAD